MCNAEQWSAVLDKYHRRRVHEVRVRCWHKDNGCDWVGEVNELKRHDDSCPKRPWECEYCGLKCTYKEGEGKHWPTCLKFPKPCPNMCEVGSVERCNIEQHLSVCPLEPVACEMKEFGCSVVVPRKELARHMRESELQHLTAMTVMNLRLTRQLQQDSTERDRKIAQLQQEMTTMQADFKVKIGELKQIQTETNTKYDEHKRKLTNQLTELKGHIQEVQLTTQHIETHTAGGTCSVCEVFTFTQYSKRKNSDVDVDSAAFYSHCQGYKLSLRIMYYSPPINYIGAYLLMMKGEYDDELTWPVEVKVRLELLNQAGDHHHVVRTNEMKWKKDKREKYIAIDNYLMKYSDLERQGDGVQYVMNNCLKFRIHITINT